MYGEGVGTEANLAGLSLQTSQEDCGYVGMERCISGVRIYTIV
jgi:hypothetical protein